MAILIVFAGVFIYFGLRNETVVKTLGTQSTKEFMTDIKEHGYFTLEEYENYMEQLSMTNSIYNVEFEHSYKIIEPEYRLRTIQEIIDAQNASYGGDNHYTYHEVNTHKPEVYDPVNEGNLNTETNESVLAKALNTPPDPNHIHTEECYEGHRHSNPANNMFIHNHKHSNCQEYIKAQYVFGTCTSCNTEYNTSAAYWSWVNGLVFEGNYNTYNCTNCGYSGIKKSSYYYDYGYSCYYNKDLDGDGFDDKVGYTIAYDYLSTVPQNEFRGNYTSGCYKYHKENAFPTYGYLNLYYNDSDVYRLFYSATEISKYCTIPRIFSFGVGDDSLYQDYQVTYTAFIDTDGVVKLRYSGWTKSYYYPGNFPQVITFQQVSDYGLTSWRVCHFIEKYTGYTIDDDTYDYSVNNFYDILDICPETQFNKWVLACGQDQNETDECNQVVMSISATHPNQTVAVGDPLITTVIATYQDGSTKTVVASTNFSTASICQNEDVTLTYQYTVSGKTYSKTCNITVSVVLRSKICTRGHTYNLNANGNDPGCPYCREWVGRIEFIYPIDFPFVITIGTTLKQNGVKLLVTYLDGHNEEITDGYMDNLDMSYLGSMIVTIGYKGKTIQFPVITEPAKMLCDICGYLYNLYPDGTDPGCPRCISKIPVFTGNILEYEETEYTDRILEELFLNEKYEFNKQDLFTISIQNKTNLSARMLLQKFIPGLSDRWLNLKISERISTY